MNGPERRVAVFPGKHLLDGFMLEEWVMAAMGAVQRRGRFVAALAGGRTPESFYELLAGSGRSLPWEDTHIFLTDERCVPAGHPDSNFGMIEAALLGRVPVPEANIHQVPVELAPGRAATNYEREMRRFFGLKQGGFPKFDLVLLGLGRDGHTASLFPGDPAVTEARRLAVAVARSEPDHDRVTLTLPVINGAEVVVFMVTGGDKAAALRSVLEGPGDGSPAARVRSRQGRTVFLADGQAGTLLKKLPRVKRPGPSRG